MDLIRMPRMEKAEYDEIIDREHICRIAFKGGEHPYIAPFLYVFDGRRMYFLSTRYGRKHDYFKENPRVTVEVESFSEDLSTFGFVTLMGRLTEVTDPEKKRDVRMMFIRMIESKELSKNVLSALGHSPDEPLESLAEGERTAAWKLVEVRKITALRGVEIGERGPKVRERDP